MALVHYAIAHSPGGDEDPRRGNGVVQDEEE